VGDPAGLRHRSTLARQPSRRRQYFSDPVSQSRPDAGDRQRARASGLAPTRLEIEITESVLLHNKEATLAVLHQLRALGIRIAMDDFGTGYSSLTYLQSFPFDKIKIDRSFVKNITENSSSLNIVRAVAALANGMGMTATAEGVETAEQLHSIASEGCTEMQGFLFSRPLPAAEIERQFLSGRGARDTQGRIVAA
jgi:EAL domain-containing protein (putative c-di-GMP-specific phosphodiesterase class I)